MVLKDNPNKGGLLAWPRSKSSSRQHPRERSTREGKKEEHRARQETRAKRGSKERTSYQVLLPPPLNSEHEYLRIKGANQAYPSISTATGQCCPQSSSFRLHNTLPKKSHVRVSATISSYSKQVHSIRLGCILNYPRAYKTKRMCCKVLDLYSFTHVD